MTHQTRMWIISLAISTALLSFTAYIIYKFSSVYYPNPNQITNEKELNNYIENKWVKEGDNSPILMPTGIFVQSLNVISSNDIEIAGFVWQKFDKHNMHIEKKGVEFSKGQSITMTEVYRDTENGVLTIVWYFEGKFLQNFDYADFPLDKKTVEIRMCPIGYEKDMLLVPDLGSYDSTKKTDKFGIEPEVVLAGYSLLETFFSYKEINYDTNFGVKDYKRKNGFHELTYNVSLKREVLSLAVIYFLPLWTVVTLMLFGVLLITVKDKDLPFLGYSLMNILSLASFLLFIIVLSHTQLRTQIISRGIMYLELVYTLSYLAIIYAIIIAFVIDKSSRQHRHGFFGHEGFWAKLSYLPIISLSICVLTYICFYGRW